MVVAAEVAFTSADEEVDDEKMEGKKEVKLKVLVEGVDGTEDG